MLLSRIIDQKARKRNKMSRFIEYDKRKSQSGDDPVQHPDGTMNRVIKTNKIKFRLDDVYQGNVFETYKPGGRNKRGLKSFIQ